jgi:hypothetical protein
MPFLFGAVMKTTLIRLNRLLYKLSIAAVLCSIAYLILLLAFGQWNRVINYWLAYRADYAMPFMCILMPLIIITLFIIKALSGEYGRHTSDNSLSMTMEQTVAALFLTCIILFAADAVRALQRVF